MFPIHRRRVALAICAVVVCVQSALAQSARTDRTTVASGATSSSMQDRLVALTQLIHFRHRGDKASLQRHRAEVEAVLSMWNAEAQPSPVDQQLMAAWLDQAIRSSMPGRSGRLPPPPRLGTPVVAAPIVTAPIVTVEPPAAVEENLLDAKLLDTRDVPTAPEQRQPSRVQSSGLPRRSKWSRHPAAAPLRWADPFTEESRSNTHPNHRGAQRYETRRPTFGKSQGVAIDLAKLSAEVRGYNAALRSLSQRLARREDVNTRALTKIAAELERLETERRFLDLYREGLSQTEQRSLPASPSAELVYELVRRKTATRLNKTPRSKNEERRALEGLVSRLARL